MVTALAFHDIDDLYQRKSMFDYLSGDNADFDEYDTDNLSAEDGKYLLSMINDDNYDWVGYCSTEDELHSKVEDVLESLNDSVERVDFEWSGAACYVIMARYFIDIPVVRTVKQCIEDELATFPLYDGKNDCIFVGTREEFQEECKNEANDKQGH